MIKNSAPVAIFWFRRDLRLIDNNGLYHALKNQNKVLPVFIFDKNILGELKNKKDRRLTFIHQTLKTLNTELQKSGSSLYILHDEPLHAFKTICEKFNVKEVFTNHDYEPYSIERDLQIRNWLQTKNISFHSFKDQVIFEKSEVMKGDGTPYTIFTPYSRIWKQKFANEKPKSFPSEKLSGNFLKTSVFDFPTLKILGFEKTEITIPEIKPTMKQNEVSFMVDKQIIKNYHLTRNFPSVQGTTHLSIHLRFGTVSVRKLAKLAAELNDQWLNELIWREFFMMILFHFPQVITQSFKKKYDNIIWRNNKKEFELWCAGKTGYPLVDAGMRELNETGLMHNRVRMVVASFLTKHLLIDWRWGEAYFAEKLSDYELSSNNGNWQWAAGCGCDAAPYFRVFNPSEQTKKFDKDLIYIKTWVKDFETEIITPIVDHDFARKRAIEAYKKGLTE